jgi:hypothetical protein
MGYDALALRRFLEQTYDDVMWKQVERDFHVTAEATLSADTLDTIASCGGQVEINQAGDLFIITPDPRQDAAVTRA